MADFYGSHFEYAGISSYKYGLIFANINTTRNLSLGSSPSPSTIFDKKNAMWHIVDNDYSSSPLSFEVEFVTDKNHPISRADMRTIEKWLFNRNSYKKLYFSKSDDYASEFQETDNYYSEFQDTEIGQVKRLYLNCRFTNPERIEVDGGIIGYKATLEADSPMFWQDTIEKSFKFNGTSSSSNNTIKIKVDTDIDDYTYPTVTIFAGSSGGTISIANDTDDPNRLSKFEGVIGNSKIVMKNDINMLSGSSSNIYQMFVGQNFFRLLDGENTIRIRGDIKYITFEFSNRRFM